MPAEAIAAWPGVLENARHEAESRRLFQRTLAGWASDVLRLQRRGLDRPAQARRTPMTATPGAAFRKAA
ncbi:MAG: hypothetical protein J0L61_02995 [Planctomycetes bacterium]|nr:hypothetical protein [Planctomycetota bacterium]